MLPRWALAVPEALQLVVLRELAGEAQEGRGYAMAVGTGLQVMAAMMHADVAAVCGPKGKHDPDRNAVRHGTESGSVTLGGRQVPVSLTADARRSTSPARCRCRPTNCSAHGGWARMAMEPLLPGLIRPAATRSGRTVLAARRAISSRDEQVRGLASVRRRDRDRAGRAAVRAAWRAGPGGVDDRRRALR